MQGQDKSEQWRAVPLSRIQFKVYRGSMTTYDGKTGTTTFKEDKHYTVYTDVEFPQRLFLKKESIIKFDIRLLKNKDKSSITAYLSMYYDDKTGIIFGAIHRSDTQGYVYIGKGEVVGDILKPVFLEGTTFNFNPRADCLEFQCATIQVVLPYTFDELKSKFSE